VCGCVCILSLVVYLIICVFLYLRSINLHSYIMLGLSFMNLGLAVYFILPEPSVQRLRVMLFI